MADHLLEERTLGARLRRLVAPAIGGDLPDPSPLPPGQPEPPPLRGIGVRRRRVAAIDRHPATIAGVDGQGDARGGDRRPRLRIDPRIRQRRIQVKREEGRRRLRALVAATTVLVLLAAGFAALRSPLLRVQRVEVDGATRTPVADVITAGGLSGHRLMIDVSPGRMAASIDRLPWVSSARVRRSWPRTVVITVTERSAVAQVAQDAGAELVDASGRVLGAAPLGTPLPVVELAPSPPGVATGAAPSPGAPGSEVPAAYRPGLSVAAALPPALVPKVVAVLAAGPGALGLRLSGGATAVLGDADQLGAKLEAVLTLVERVQIGSGTIDASVPSAPVLTPGGGVATFSTRTGG